MKKHVVKISVVSLLALSFVLSPSFAHAKNDKKPEDNENRIRVEKVKAEKQDKKEDGGKEKEDKKENVKCWKAYGHLISFGWLKRNEKPAIDANCFLPFGIAKKLSGIWKPSTPDTAAPVISSISTVIGTSTAAVAWVTDEKATSKIYYGTTTPLATSSPSTLFKMSNAKVILHSLSLSGLATSTTYYAMVESKDASGNTATSSQFSFTTQSGL